MSFAAHCSVVDITVYEDIVEARILLETNWAELVTQILQAVGRVESDLGPIICLVNNAGINLGPRLLKNEPREVRSVLE